MFPSLYSLLGKRWHQRGLLCWGIHATDLNRIGKNVEETLFMFLSICHVDQGDQVKHLDSFDLPHR